MQTAFAQIIDPHAPSKEPIVLTINRPADTNNVENAAAPEAVAKLTRISFGHFRLTSFCNAKHTSDNISIPVKRI